MTVCRGGLFTTWIEWALCEEPVSPACIVLRCQWCSRGPCSALHNFDQLLHSHPPRSIMVLMVFYLMWKWHVIFYGFHNSQAIWPDDHHAQQLLLPHSLTKLGVHWVCAGCNKLAMCRAHLGHTRRHASPWKSRNIRTSFGKKEVQNHKLYFSLQKCAYPFSLLTQRAGWGVFFIFFLFILWNS